MTTNKDTTRRTLPRWLRWGLALGAVFVLLTGGLFVRMRLADRIPPPPNAWVTDHAKALSSATRASLDRRLERYEASTGTQIVVWIDDTLDGRSLDAFAARAFERWKVGRRGADDGVALFVFTEDRAARIEVGYGLETRVTDLVAAKIIRDVTAPNMRSGDADTAIVGTVDALTAAIEGRPFEPKPAAEPASSASQFLADHEELLHGIGSFLLALVFGYFIARKPKTLLGFVLRGLLSGLLRSDDSKSKRRSFRGGGGRSGGGGASGNW